MGQLLLRELRDTEIVGNETRSLVLDMRRRAGDDTVDEEEEEENEDEEQEGMGWNEMEKQELRMLF